MERSSGGAALPLHLQHLLADAVLLEPRQVLGEELAVQVVDLVLDAHGQQAIGLQREGLAIQTQRRDGDGVGALDLVVDAGDGQAPFLVALQRVAGPGDLGVDEDLQLVMVISMTTTRSCTLTCVAASPMPGAAYMVSAMSATSLRIRSSTTGTRSATVCNRASGYLSMSSTAIGHYPPLNLPRIAGQDAVRKNFSCTSSRHAVAISLVGRA